MLKTITNWLVAFLHIQLIITLFSLPLFILWGLPISYANLLGNFIFSPLLFVFITLCCLITFFSLLGLPIFFFTYLLEKTSSLWYWLLSWGSPAWLTGCPQFMLPIVLMCCGIFYLFYQKYNPTKREQVPILFLLLTFIFVLKSLPDRTVSFDYDHMHVIHHSGKTYCIDHGTFSRKRSAQSWIDYTLLPDLIKYTGSPHIDLFITYKNNKRTYRAAKQLERQACIDQIAFSAYRTRNRTSC